MVDDRLRSYPHWLASRNLANEASDESVEALIEAVRGRYELPRRWYRLKAQLLGLDRLADYDRMAAVTDEDETIPWARRARTCARLVRRLLARAGRHRAPFFDERRIDAPVRPGKRGGAFCSYTVPSAAPVRDAQLHVAPPRRADARARARPRRARRARAAAGRLPLRDAADAGRDRERVRRDARLRPPARGGADAGVAARPAGRDDRGLDRDRVPPGRDEPVRAPRIHTARREQGELSLDRIGELWASRRRSCSATPSRSPRATAAGGPTCRTSSTSPGYVYAYAYGQLLALAVYGRYEEEGAAFVPAYLELLRRRRLDAARGARGDRRHRPRRPGLLGPRARPRRAERQLDAAEQAARDAGRL